MPPLRNDKRSLKAFDIDAWSELQNGRGHQFPPLECFQRRSELVLVLFHHGASLCFVFFQFSPMSDNTIESESGRANRTRIRGNSSGQEASVLANASPQQSKAADGQKREWPYAITTPVSDVIELQQPFTNLDQQVARWKLFFVVSGLNLGTGRI